MFAVIKTGGKQYRVAAEDVIEIEKLPAEAGATVIFEEVLLVGDGDKSTVGTPLVKGASVAGEVVEQTRGDKIRIFKKKRRKGYRRTAGHRQHLTVVKITDILTDGAKKAAAKAKPVKAAKSDDKAEDKKPAKADAKKADAPKAEAKEAEAPKADAKKAEPKATAKPEAKTEETKPAKADKE